LAAVPDQHSDRHGSGVLDAIEGLAVELEQVQLRVTALERRMDTRDADPGPELVARRVTAAQPSAGAGWERFDQRAKRLVEQLAELEQTARTALGAAAGA
jgi:hypothetical protein